MSETPSRPRGARNVFWAVVLLLVVAQQWSGYWSSETLVFGFLPSPLFYHVMVSLAAVVVWWIGTVVAWPDDALDAKCSGSGPAGGPLANETSATEEPS